MSNPEEKPALLDCPAGAPGPAETAEPPPGVEIIGAREVPLGGLRAMTVRRTLPARGRSLIGAWCFIDHYGPDRIAESGGMKVAPHPHIGLQTVSWLFTGKVEHRDSAGNHAMVVPGELNLMTAGRGISHSEISSDDVDAEPVLHGVQLWTALPAEALGVEPHFDHHRPEPVQRDGATVRVFLGTLLGESSPVPTYTPLLGAEILLEAGARLDLDVEPGFEHGLLVDAGGVRLLGRESDDASGPSGAGQRVLGEVSRDVLGYLAPGLSTIRLEADEETRLLLVGGPPFEESIVMWWNFVGRSHEEIVEARAEWERAITDPASGAVIGNSQQVVPTRFGTVIGDELPPISPPELPRTKLLLRRRDHRVPAGQTKEPPRF